MKKLITIILILAVLLPTMAMSEDYSSKSFEELIDINKIIQLNLFEKGALVDGVMVPAGVYIVGEDIPAGTYRITYTPVYETSYCSFLATNEADWIGYSTLLGPSVASEIGKIELTDGTRVEITGGDVCFYTYTGLFH